jgi:hypothetical protein
MLKKLQSTGKSMRKYILLLLISLSLFQLLGAFSQGRWVHAYHENVDSPVHFIIESYDKGYLLLGKHGANYSKYNWLIKTDINGEVLWEKTIGDGTNSIALFDMGQDHSGDTYMCGITGSYDPDRDPLIIKLDSCGEKQWCRVFYTENNYDYASNLTVLRDGDVIIILNLTNPELWVDPICLAKLSSNGELIWKQCYTTSDTSQRNETTSDLICTPDHGFLITGFCYYEDPTFPNHWIPHPYFLKTDSLGNFEWETVVFKETNLDGGGAWTTVVSPDSMFYFSSISHYLYDENQALPALVKMDMFGNVIDVYDVVNGYKYGKLTYAQFINDSTLAAEAAWGNNTDSVWSRAVIIDTLGNLLNNTVLLQNDYTSILQITFDGKLLYGSNIYQNNQFDCYLTKLNQNLEDDTIYTMPFTYDSLCPYQIISDTLVQDDCGLIVGIEDEEDEHGSGEAGKRGGMEIWPNPAREQLHIRLNMDSLSASWRDGRFIKDWTLVIYDIFGRKVHEIKVPDGQKEIQINVEGFSPGVYVVILKNGFNILESRKFIVAH